MANDPDSDFFKRLEEAMRAEFFPETNRGQHSPQSTIFNGLASDIDTDDEFPNRPEEAMCTEISPDTTAQHNPQSTIFDSLGSNTDTDDEFLSRLEEAMRTEFFPDTATQNKTESTIFNNLEPLLPKAIDPSIQLTSSDFDQLHSVVKALYPIMQPERLDNALEIFQGLTSDKEEKARIESFIRGIQDYQRNVKGLVNLLETIILPLGKGIAELGPEIGKVVTSQSNPSPSGDEKLSMAMPVIERLFKPLLNLVDRPDVSEAVPALPPMIRAMNSMTHLMSKEALEKAKSIVLPDLSSFTRFQYSRLRTQTSIRILRIEATDDKFADANQNLIKLRFEEVDLNDNPKFNALSYVWGNYLPPLNQARNKRAERIFDVLCNNQRMSVTYNLFCFLRRLLSATRRPLCDIRDMPLWIDQLCINQSDDSEKAVQVAMMDRVYNQAERVVSWLGESDSSIEAATKLLRRLSDVQLSQVSQADFDVARFVKDIPREEWFGLGSLLSRPYFKRAWIVQEIAMAKQLLVVCGQHILRWEDLVHCSSIIETTGAWKMLSQYAELFRPVQDHISPDARHCQLFRYGGQLATLLDAQRTIKDQSLPPENLLLLGKQFDATVIADKYFAMLGLYKRQLSTTTVASDLLAVNYSKSLKQISLDFAVYHIQTTGSLQLLSLVEDSARRTLGSADFPSWLPDPGAPLLPLPFDANAWGGSRPSPPRKPPIVNADNLLVQGQPLDTVTLVAIPFNSLKQTHEWFHLFDFIATCPRPKNISRGTALWRTLTTNQLPLSPKSPDTTPPHLAHDFTAWCISLAIMASSPNTDMFEPWMADSIRRFSRREHLLFDLFTFGPGLVDASNFMDIIDNGHLDSGIAKAYEDRRSQEKEEGKYEWRRSKFDEAFRRIRDVCQNEREGNEQGEENVFPDPQWRKFKKLEAPLFHDEPADLVEQRQELKYRADRFAAAIGMKLDSRRLFYTANGSLGMGPESLQEEDEIWEIDGLQALAVVRKMDSGVYRFVGEAFVLGLMRSQNRDPASLSQLVDVVLK